MAMAIERVRSRLALLQERLGGLTARTGGTAGKAVERWRTDAAALLFHLADRPRHPVLLAVIGGTGTGKSTLVNRLIGSNVSATSFRRTFTSGSVAVASEPGDVPEGWLGLPRTVAGPEDIPVRGQAGQLIIVPARQEITQQATLVDTPDVDGDQPVHLAEADRAFRWAQAVLFLVTPEKYQMTELLAYYRLARRYGLSALFVMNKCEEAVVLEDYRAHLAEREWNDALLFAVPRDDAAYEPPPQAGLAALRRAIGLLEPASPAHYSAGISNRCGDLMSRWRDQILAPLRADRARVERLKAALWSLRTAADGVDVSPLTQQLQRRMQEQSVLYLMGPGRMIERVRQLPGILARLPRTTWDLVVRGEHAPLLTTAPAAPPEGPDFRGLLADQMVVVQSRIDDLLRGDPAVAGWLEEHGEQYAAAKIDPALAGRIAEEELAELKAWLEQRWESSPRDTQVIQKLLKSIPGAKRLSQWSEAAPYLLAVVVAAHGAVFGPLDLVILGTWSLATWIGEKLSNEVTARTRQTNRRIAERFDLLAREQIDKMRHWLETQAPGTGELDQLERLADEVSDAVSGG